MILTHRLQFKLEAVLCVSYVLVKAVELFHKVNAKYCYYKPNNEVAAGRKVKAWVDDRDATLWAHNCTDVNEMVVYVKYVDKDGKEHKIYPSLPKGTLPNNNAQIVGRNASYVIEVGWCR